MSRSVNTVHIIGRLGANPEMTFTPTGKEVLSLSLACGRQWKDANGEAKTETEWINVEGWGTVAKILNQYTKKGDLLYVEGRIKTDKYEKDGQKKYFTKVVIGEFMLLGTNGGASAPAGVMVEVADEAPVTEDFPF